MRYVCLIAFSLSLLSGQDGAAIYKERCASCHDAPQPRVPSLATIKAMSSDAVYLALSSGTMKSRAESLGITDIFALIGYIAPAGSSHQDSAASFAATCQGDAAFTIDPKRPQWNGWSPSLTNSRFADAAGAGLTSADVSKLKLKWALRLGDITEARSQPVIVGRRAFSSRLQPAPSIHSMPLPAARAGDFRPAPESALGSPSARPTAPQRSFSGMAEPICTRSMPAPGNCSGKCGR